MRIEYLCQQLVKARAECGFVIDDIIHSHGILAFAHLDDGILDAFRPLDIKQCRTHGIVVWVVCRRVPAEALANA